MSTITIPKILANFETSLAATMSAAATTLTLNASVDGDGTTLSGLYSLTFDEGTSSEEHMLVTLAGAAGTVSKRKLSRVDAFTEVEANKFVHNRGASVKCTNVSAINIQRLLNGDDTFNSVAWTGVASIAGLSTPTSGETTKAVNVAYANALAIAGAPDATTTVKGISEEATQAEIAAGTAAGATSARLFTNPSTLAPHIQAGTWLYAAEDGSGSDDTYTASLTPALTAYTTGMMVNIKLTVANTGACTLNLNGLGAKNIKKYVAGAQGDPETGDIVANQFCLFYYDGTSMVLLNPSAAMPTTANLQLVTTNIGTLTAGSTSNADTLHTHNPASQNAALFSGGSIHLPVFLADANVVISNAYFGASRLWKRPGSFSVMLDNTNSAAAIRGDGVDTMAGAGGDDGLFDSSSGTPADLSKNFTAIFRFRFGVVPASTDTFFVGFASDADTLDASYASPTTSTHMGYEWNGTNWRITNGSGTTQTTTNIATPSTGWHELKIQRIASTSIIFTLDGSALGTHTTNLPASGGLLFYFVLDGNSGTTRYIEISRFIDMYIATT
jgi:hypothetical protein